MKGLVKRLLREGLNNLISEDVNMAIKLLKTNNIPIDNPEYLRAKDFLVKNNSIGFLGQVVRIGLNYNNEFYEISEYILNNKDLIKNLPKPLSNYKDFLELENAVLYIQNNRIVKKLTTKLTNKLLIKLLLENTPDSKTLEEIKYFLDIKYSDQKEFLSKSDKYNDIDSFYNDLKNFNDNNKIGFYYENIVGYINGMSEDDIRLLYKKNNMILARIITYRAAKKIGSNSWCIVGEEEQFDYYTNNGSRYQYFFFNFNSNIEPSLQMIAFTLDENNNITASHDRYDAQFNGIVPYLEKIGIKEKIFLINSRERQKNKLSSIDKGFNNNNYLSKTYLYYFSNKKINKDGKEEITYTYPNNYNKKLFNVGDKFLSTLFGDEIKNTNHLDIVFKKFQSYPVSIITQNQDVIDSSTDIISLVLTNFDVINNNQYAIEEFLNLLKKVYLSNINITKELKINILSFLKKNNVDILKLSQTNKGNKGIDLGDAEFNMLSRRGENMRPIIQNKLSAFRRGENVNLTHAEINYAIDNGFKNIIEKYYRNMLPSFGENQLSYEDLMIYKKLGLLNDIARVIISKANNFGIETLNSIEKSLYDTNKYTQKV